MWNSCTILSVYKRSGLGFSVYGSKAGDRKWRAVGMCYTLTLVVVTERRDRRTRHFKSRWDNGINHDGDCWENWEKGRGDVMCLFFAYSPCLDFILSQTWNQDCRVRFCQSMAVSKWIPETQWFCSKQSIFFMLCKPLTSHTSFSNYMFNVGLNYVFYLWNSHCCSQMANSTLS